MSNEQILARYMRHHYSDADLSALLAHAEDGKLSYFSCCCFIGVPTADHALRGMIEGSAASQAHYRKAEMLPDANDAELAFNALCGRGFGADWAAQDARRRELLIPLIRAEMDRREKERSSSIQSDLGERVTV